MRPNFNLALAVLALLAAGCLGGPSTPRTYELFADQASFSVGFAYDGKAARGINASAYLKVTPRTDEGIFTVRSEDPSMHPPLTRCPGTWGPMESGEPVYALHMRTFSGSEPFHAGGLAENLVEHGDSQVGDPDIPRVSAIVAAWGTGSIFHSGVPLTNPVTGTRDWKVHFMWVRTAIRDDQTRAIYNATREQPYDPGRPADGYSEPGVQELLVEIESGPRTAASRNHQKSSTGSVPVSPNFERSYLVYNPLEGGAATFYLNVTLTPGSTVDSIGLCGPTGDVAGVRKDLGSTIGWEARLDPAPYGFYSITYRGRSLTISDEHSVHVVPKPVVYNLWFDQVVTGPGTTTAARRAGHPVS